MTAPFDPLGNATLINNIIQLVKSPRVRQMGESLRRATGTVGQPFGLHNTRGMSTRAPSQSRTPGASPNTGIGQAFGRGIGQVISGLGQNPTQSDPLMDLYAQLINQLQQPVQMPTGIDTDNLMQQVQNAINPIYDQRIQQAQDTADYATDQVREMYRALSNDYERLAPQQVEQAEAAQQDIQQLYGQLRSNITGDYARVSKEQADLFQDLGIEAALPEVLDQQDDSVTEALTAAAQTQAQNEQRYSDIGQMDATYFRQGSPMPQ